MTILRNEKGAALLIVFLILILFTVLGISVMTTTMQSAQIRKFTDSEIEGKMLADIGLTYFQEYIEEKLKDKKPSENIDREVISFIEEIASPMHTIEDKNNIESKKILLPKVKGERGESGFAIFYELGNKIEYSDGSSELSQPYVRKVAVSVLGIPSGSNVSGTSQKKVRLNATVYINTIPAPFHSAVSTKGNLLLFGGTNIIGNVAANNIITTNQYYYKDEDEKFQTEKEDDNIPYIEGKVMLSNTGQLYQVDLSSYQDDKKKPNVTTSSEGVTKIPDFSLVGLKKEKLFTPLDTDTDTDREERSAPSDAPCIPGLEPPMVEATHRGIPDLFYDQKKVGEYIQQQLADAKESGTELITIGETDEPITFDEKDKDNGFSYYGNTPPNKKLYIESEQPDGNPSPLTVRLTGNELKDKINKLYIAPSDTSNTPKSVTVEMGRQDTFEKLDSEPKEEPFTYNGIIVIRGNLDIYNDIDMNGVIYVDGDVVIREATNKSKEKDNNKLAIIASGSLTLANRYIEAKFDDNVKKWTSKNGVEPSPLYAFLYTDNSLDIYSHISVNHIIGGIGIGDGQIALNTSREGASRAARLTIQFNRKIFEEAFPGLPSDQQFFLDLYDIEYTVP